MGNIKLMFKVPMEIKCPYLDAINSFCENYEKLISPEVYCVECKCSKREIIINPESGEII